VHGCCRNGTHRLKNSPRLLGLLVYSFMGSVTGSLFAYRYDTRQWPSRSTLNVRAQIIMKIDVHAGCMGPHRLRFVSGAECDTDK
jgi:hypothetical protein